ncbi:RsmE family RNA methyltransferase [Weissella confusa]|uniref:Ribosomal RNA small subunit methyltransferase E n=1 Tax=Weissella confusa TaxID=1583 RepID=A0A923NJG5_WEICO|nr:RsmE family RNA methyltransferase [Weissella confusa]
MAQFSRLNPGDKIAFLVGPEGGLKESELDLLTKTFGFVPAQPELVVQKATELGVHHVIIVETDWSVVHWGMKADKKLARLQKIAQGAAEQSHRLRVPDVTYVEKLRYHLMTVLRGKEGTQAEFVYPDQQTMVVAEVIRVDDETTTMRVVEEVTTDVELPVETTIILGLAKGDVRYL